MTGQTDPRARNDPRRRITFRRSRPRRSRTGSRTPVPRVGGHSSTRESAGAEPQRARSLRVLAYNTAGLGRSVNGYASRRPGRGRASSVTSREYTPVWVLLVLTAVVAVPIGGHAQEPDYRVLGSADAPVEMAILSDFECPYCRNFALGALPALFAEFVDRGLLRLRFVYFPLADIHPNAVIAAKAAHCAGRAGRFWPYHDYVFVRQPEWAGEETSDSLWIEYATNLGIEPAEFSECLASEATHTVVEADLRQALSAGATGTPTVVLDGTPISGISSYETLREQILEAIEEARR